jgi:hypothetical protein
MESEREARRLRWSLSHHYTSLYIIN